MSGRFGLAHTPQEIRAAFGYAERPDFPPRPQIAPAEPIAIVAAREFTQGRERAFMLARWGLLPAFVREPLPLLLYARAEGLLDRPSFAPAFRRRRCLVPASGFQVFAGKRRHFVAAADAAPLALAGLFETYLHPNGSEVDTACLITLAAGPGYPEGVERVPVVIPREAFTAWLDHETTPLASALALLAPPRQGLLRTRPSGDG